MPSVLYLLSQRITTAIQTAFGQAAEEVDPAVAAASDPKFGHYQCNAAMTLARRVGQKPREVAMAIIARPRTIGPVSLEAARRFLWKITI